MRSTLFLLLVAGASMPAWSLTNRPWAYTAPPPRAAAAEAPDTPGDDERIARGRAAYAAANAALRAGDIPSAADAIRTALESLPSDGLVMGLAGRIFTFEGNHGIAEGLWRRILSSYPENAPALAGLAGTLLYAGRADEARRELDAARRIDPANRTARFYAAVLAARDDTPDSIAAAFLNPSYTDTRLFAEQMLQEKSLLEPILTADRYRQLVAALIGSPVTGDPDSTLRAIVSSLDNAEQATRKRSWSAFEAALIAARDAGIVSPGLDFDIALARYWQAPGDSTLDAVEAIILRSPLDILARNFALLCLQVGEPERAARVCEPVLAKSPHKEATLLRAAIRQGAGDPQGAWDLLATIPAAERPGWIRWFDQTQPAIRALKADPRFAAWRGDS